MVVFSHPTANANVRAAAYGLAELGLLSEFQTAVASFPGTMLDHLGAVGLFSEIRRRSFDPTLKSVTKTWPWLEVGRLLALKAGFSKLIKHESGLLSIDSVYQGFDRHVAYGLKNAAKRGARAVYAYEDGAASSFSKAKLLNLKCFYDLPIGYWRTAQRLLEPERKRWPEWASTLTGFQNSETKLARKDEELRLADRIFVASQFTARTLQDFPGSLAPIEVIPYGFPPVQKTRDYFGSSRSRSLKLLFVGGLSQRKGIANLFTAVQTLGSHVELTVVGRKVSSNCSALDAALVKHRWIPTLQHQDILKLMQVHDVLVFPSLFEGFGLVITEAMSQGTPVITTERTAGPDLIKNGQNGWLIEAGSTESLQAAIENLLYQPSVISEAGKVAMETARHRPWKIYGKELAEAIIRSQNNN